jgi:ubiquinone/menaquinone biosynthesis C-methylase UbiE
VGWWTERMLPRLVDRVLDNDEVNTRRKRACEGLTGTVVEIGFGSGLNVAFYPAAVSRLLAVEPSDVAWRLAAPRREATSADIRRAGLDGERLDLPDESADAALSTYTLCVIPDLPAALAEIRRILRPGGQLHFLEHGWSPDPRVHTWQHRLTPWQRRLAGGCHLDRKIDAALVAAGFELTELHTTYGTGPRWFSYLYSGRASRL